MTKKLGTKDAVRGVFFSRELDKAQYFLMGGMQGLVVRVALATLLMFMLLTAYTMMGDTGTIMVTSLFLMAMLSPFLVHHAKKLLRGKDISEIRGVGNGVDERQLQEQDS
ncbi:MAG: hypothetical protein GY731_07815 [Gammaproteobacteria bacterium]|nr:hypothetical protein [Gammaproteobacteria bacterium]